MKHIDIDTDALIQALKTRPALYNKDHHLYYSQKNQKASYWAEVYKELIPNWDNLKSQEKVLTGHEIQRRWKSLRTCFTREVSLQKREKLRRAKNIPVKRRKVYSYFRALSFLLPNVTAASGEEARSNDDDSSSEEGPTARSVKTEEEFPESTNENHFMEVSDSFSRGFDAQNEDEIEIEYTNTKGAKRTEDDADRQFLLSLLPSFKKLNDKQKFDARIEILKVMRDISFREDTH